MSATPTIGRRRLLRDAAVATAGLVIAFHLGRLSALAEEEPSAPDRPLPRPDAFLRIGTDSSVTVLLAHTEQSS